MARRKTKRFSPEQKLKIVREGMQPNVMVAELCRHYDIYPTDYYRWKKLAEEAMVDGLKPKQKKQKPLNKREQDLLEENQRLQQVIIQLTKEHLEL